jgi:hypothetical protein
MAEGSRSRQGGTLTFIACMASSQLNRGMKNLISRSQLKSACESKDWDLLDKLLETDATHINDNALFTDTWGEWWGMLMFVIGIGSCDGLRVMLKHGADRTVGSWGDGMPQTPLEAAAGNPEILALLLTPERPAYIRHTDPALPKIDPAIEKQARIRSQTGMVFQAEVFKTDSSN